MHPTLIPNLEIMVGSANGQQRPGCGLRGTLLGIWDLDARKPVPFMHLDFKEIEA